MNSYMHPSVVPSSDHQHDMAINLNSGPQNIIQIVHEWSFSYEFLTMHANKQSVKNDIKQTFQDLIFPMVEKALDIPPSSSI